MFVRLYCQRRAGYLVLAILASHLLLRLHICDFIGLNRNAVVHTSNSQKIEQFAATIATLHYSIRACVYMELGGRNKQLPSVAELLVRAIK